MSIWGFNPILGSYATVAVLTLGLVLLLLVAPPYRQLSARRRGMLMVLRCLVILLLLLALLRPTRIATTKEPQSALLVVMFDVSRSMQLPSAAGDRTRWERQRSALEAIESDLRELGRDLDVKVYGYDQQLYEVGFDENGLEFPDAPKGEQTDLGTTLHDAVQRELGKRLVGIVVLGDGAQTAFVPRVEVQQAAREIARMDYPLFTVTFGPVGDVGQSRDVVIENLPEQYTVFVKNELAVRGSLRVRGYAGQEIPVELLLEDARGDERLLATRGVTVRQDGEQVPVEMTYVPETPGQYKITMRAAHQAGELVTQNNELTAFVNVLEGGLKVLYIYGDLMGERRLLRPSIAASPDIQLDDLFLSPANADSWPLRLEELRKPEYDVLLLESVDAKALDPAALQAVAESVEQGKGLMMIGGFQSFGPGGYQTTVLNDVLPVRMGRFERQDLALDRPISRDLHLWGELAMLPTRDHPITQLAPEGENERAWKTLPPLIGANKLDVKPAGQVLAATSDGDPLLISGRYGRGRVLAFAGNSTIRWWQFGRKSDHRRFWRQAILWLASREDLNKTDVWIKLEQRRFNPGSRVAMTAGATTATGEVVVDGTFRVKITGPGQSSSTLLLAAGGEEEGSFAGEFQVQDPGDYLVELTVDRGGRVVGTSRTSFQVLDRDVERSNPVADYELMARLANQTRAAGGEALAPEQLPSLMQQLKQRKYDLDIEVESKWQLGDTWWDAWSMMLALAGLLTAEWALRKKWGLV